VSGLQQAFTFRVPTTTQRHNLVIEAGAGTGKTTAIVAEVLKLLLGNEELAPERIVLMTFTEKAAGEIADRIHQALTECSGRLQPADSSADAPAEAGAYTWPARSPHPLLTITGEMREAAAKQLARVDQLRSQTIHSFCQMLLRQFPIEAGLDSQFTIVEGFERSRLYGELYDAWVDEETRVHPSAEARHDWEVLLEHSNYLFLIRELIFGLIDRRDLLLDETYDIGSIAVIEDDILEAMRVVAIEGGDTPMARYFRANQPARGDLDAWIEYLKPVADEIRETDLPRGRKNDAMSAALKILRSGDKGVCVVDRLTSHRAALSLLAMTRRFVVYLDAEKRARGMVDFDDLLLRTLALLDDDAVLERVRRQFDYIFVDEFQDTDRVQARIIERLARDGSGALVPGRTVVVGDPKQSIYGFRRADPETYAAFTRDLIDGGAEHRLIVDQYRSEPALLDAINELFAKIFEPIAPDPNVFSPPYHALRAAKTPHPPFGHPLPASRGEGHSIESPSPRLRGEGARRADEGPPFLILNTPNKEAVAEADAIASWINENNDGDLRRFAILLRRMTKLDDYLDGLDRHGVRYVLPPTRQFLERPAAVDLLAVLRAVAYPFDRGAEVSAARSLYFAMTDLEIVAGLEGLKPVLHSFRDHAERLTVTAMIDLVIETCGIERVYAATVDGDRAMRHLEHLRGIAFQYDQTVGGSLRQFVDEIGRRRAGEPDEMEPSLLDDSSNGVRILTVHAAKGLEFDTVILPDLEFPLKAQELYVVDDPRLLVMSGQVETLSSLRAKEIAKQREEAENRRLFYVAVTRAKSQVVFVTNEKAYNIGFAKYVKEHCVAAGFSRPTDGLKPVLHGAQRKLADAALEAQLAAAPPVPLLLPECRTGFSPSPTRPILRGRTAGILLHRFLERWDGRAPAEPLLAALAREQGCDDETHALVRRRAAALARSETYRRIADAEIVGRELPIAFVDESGVVINRRLDRLIRIDGRDVVVDYKSGEVDDLRVARDRRQVEEYCGAVARITGQPCSGWIWYVDSDQVVAV
jgi:ATP-dependent helicase/nuclease subunit A